MYEQIKLKLFASRFDFVIDANYEAKPKQGSRVYHDDNYEHSNDENYSFNPNANLDGTKYEHNLGVFPIRFEGLLMCEGVFVSSDALLVYHKPNSNRETAEIELASLYQESRQSVPWRV